MDYILKISMKIDTEDKKNTFRDFLKAKLETEYSAGNIKSWEMDIIGQIVPIEDVENYHSP